MAETSGEMSVGEKRGISVSSSVVAEVPLTETPLVPLGSPVVVWTGAGWAAVLLSCVGAEVPLSVSSVVTCVALSLTGAATSASWIGAASGTGVTPLVWSGSAFSTATTSEGASLSDAGAVSKTVFSVADCSGIDSAMGWMVSE